jgi:acetyltransferase-like isoleucine patch superfamily enzyme
MKRRFPPKAVAALRALRRRMPGGLRITSHGQGNSVECPPRVRVRDTAIAIDGGGNRVVVHDSARLEHCRIVISGSGNVVELGASSLSGLHVSISGNRNRIAIEDGCMTLSLSLVCEDDGNTISIGEGSQFHGAADLAAIEGTRISIGPDCLFSGGVHVRTGDSHAVVDLAGARINFSADVIIGAHVWLGQSVIVLKGSAIPDHSVVGAGAVVTRRFESPQVAIAGNPARVVREGIDWRHDRHPAVNPE